MIQPRPYQDERDLERMLSLLVEGRQAEVGTYYVHTGDLKWWLFYANHERWQDIYLWEQNPGEDLLGWTLLSPEWPAFDVFVQPELRDSPQAEAIFAWAEQDIVATAPDGRITAFCIVWPDALDRVGLFEPVGTHPDFQRKGLGRAVVGEGLRRLRAAGMQTAIVCAVSDNPAAYHLYESAGFRSIQKISALVKEL